MSDYQIVTDSSCDIPEELIKKHKIRRVPFYVSFDQEKYLKEIEDISVRRFYKKLISAKRLPKTSLPSIDDYIKVFEKILNEGKDVYCITISSLFSGSYQAALAAKDVLEEDHPKGQIVIVDSKQATGGQGLLVLQAVYMKQSGLSLAENAARLAMLSETAHIKFTISTLEYLQKGGRIGKAASLAGNMLNLKPLIDMCDGELHPVGTARGRHRSLAKIIDMMEDYFESTGEDPEDYDFCICRGADDTDAARVREHVEEFLGKPVAYPFFQVGVTIGTYTGPDPVGIAFVKKFGALHLDLMKEQQE